MRPQSPAIAGIVWVVSLLLFALGTGWGNPAALLLAQIGWATLLTRSGPGMWCRFPVAAVVLVFGYLCVGEGAWFLFRVAGWTSAQLSHAVPVVFSLVLAVAALIVNELDPGAIRAAIRRRSLQGAVAEAGSLVMVYAMMLPALRPGARLGSVQFVIPGYDQMHNIARAALVERTGFIPYGRLSPVADLSGDYYPRGFHLVVAWLNSAVGVDLDRDLQLWIVGYARMFWLFWALTAVALASLASVVAARLGASPWLARLAAGASGLLILIPEVVRGIVLPGFPAFTVALCAVLVSLRHHLGRGTGLAAVVLHMMAFVVTSHGWLILAPLPLSLAGLEILRLTLASRRADGARAWWLRPLAVVAAFAISLVATRPLAYSWLSGDASTQAREPGLIMAAPLNVVVVAAVILLVLVLSSQGRSLALALALPAVVTALVVLVGLRAADWDVTLYYPRKIVWAVLLLMLPLAIAAILRLLASALARFHNSRWTLRVPLGMCIVVVGVFGVVVWGPAQQLFLNRPAVEPTSVVLAERAVEVGAQYQLIAAGTAEPEDDRLASMWARAVRNVRGLPALDVSEIDYTSTPPEMFCNYATERGVPAHVITRRDGELVDLPCNAGAPS